ncbi:DNA binding protein SART-1 [Teratosphaeria destructans]|uniref:DNA binding protein SART-1 n=1 Tax=Teratosphaeria destructans TaxID=418781 RepID=A0A9W7SLA9_9PEZI|nr:DNA binding protein SART-1 [Teratosphaeria destructans]
MAANMDAAQIEAMNKVRASLGMAPLPMPGKSGPQFKVDESGSDEEDDISTLDKRAALADKNWQKLEAERREKEEREKRKAATKKARNAAARFAKMEGKGLGDADEEDEQDTRSWLLGQKKRQKKIDKARKMAEELAEREQQQAEYTSKDLAGVKVGHQADDFDETTGEQVLTLKDTAIGEESEDDELENAELRAKEKLEEKLKLKKKRPDYDPTEQGEVKAVLSKYDEEIEGKQGKNFTLDGKGSTVESKKKSLEGDGQVKSKGVKIDLDMLVEDTPISDYMEPANVKVKKPKKKKEKKSRQRAADEEDIFPVQSVAQSNGDAMEVDDAQGSSAGKKRALEFDDDDLQAKLAEQRREALKKRKKTDAAELARQLREEMPVDDQEPEEVGLIMDETTEFVANLKKPEAPESRETKSQLTPAEDEEDEDGDANMESYADAAEAEDRAQRERATSTPAADITATGLDEEDTMSGSGLGASLAMLRKRGIVHDTASADLTEKERQRAKFLADKQHLIDEYDQKAREQREMDRRSGRWDRMSNRERDAYARQQNEAREQYLARLQADMFNKQYRPDVKLQYHDEYGRSMNQKEAFKHLSHMFHGKGSGKMKTEKRLKKIEDEKREQGKGVLGVSEEGGFLNVQGREGKRQKQAGVRLQ